MPKGIYQRKPRKQSLDAASNDDHDDDDPKIQTTQTGSLKLVLRVPRLEQTTKEEKSGGKEQPSSENDSDMELLSDVKQTSCSKEATPVIEESDQEAYEDDKKEESGSTTKKRRKRKRFRLTFWESKRKKQQAKAASAPNPAPEESPEPEEPQPELLEDSVPQRERLSRFRPLQLLLDYLLRCFQKKDPEEYFMFPVTDEIAPNYSKVITEPMDFSTMRSKVDKDEYMSLDDFRTDLELICSNALAYNGSETVYFKAAKKLQALIHHYISSSNLMALHKLLPFMSFIKEKELGDHKIPAMSKAGQQKASKRMALQCESLVEDVAETELLASIQKAAIEASANLAARRPNTHLAFVNQNASGATFLNVLTPTKVSYGEEGEEGKSVCLGDLIPKLKEGTPGLSAFTEQQENLAVPVAALDYGPFSSFAPHFDSTWASLSKRESDLVAVYGDKASAQYALSLRDFVADSSTHLFGQVHQLLNTLTDGEHENTLTEEEKNEMRKIKVPSHPPEEKTDTSDVNFESLRSLANLGIDVSFLDDLERHLGGARREVDERLERTGALLEELEKTQNERLNQQPDFVLTRTGGPTVQETEIAGSVVNRLQELTAQARPGSFFGSDPIRSSMGISTPSEEFDMEDMEVLREFFQVDTT